MREKSEQLEIKQQENTEQSVEENKTNKRKHAMLFETNDSKGDLCSPAKRNVHTPSEAALKLVQDLLYPFHALLDASISHRIKKQFKTKREPNDARNYRHYVTTPNSPVCEEAQLMDRWKKISKLSKNRLIPAQIKQGMLSFGL